MTPAMQTRLRHAMFECDTARVPTERKESRDRDRIIRAFRGIRLRGHPQPSYPEVAAVFGVSQSTAISACKRARVRREGEEKANGC